jgi:hypothetical protein
MRFWRFGKSPANDEIIKRARKAAAAISRGPYSFPGFMITRYNSDAL